LYWLSCRFSRHDLADGMFLHRVYVKAWRILIGSLKMSRDRPIERCPECGNVLKMEYIGPTEDAHSHDHHGHDAHGDGVHNYEGEPKTFADFVRPEYR
jgi:hypothetical protein